MAYCLVRLSQIVPAARAEEYRQAAERQLAFLSGEANRYPAGYGMFLTALLMYLYPPQKITAVLSKEDSPEKAFARLPLYADITILAEPSGGYGLSDGRTTYYVCRNHTCFPPSNIPPSNQEHF